MLDAAVAGRHGGTGRAFDWSLLEERPLGRPFALAGGLRPETVAEAVRRLRPALVDVSSGVESAPGPQGRGARRAPSSRRWPPPGRSRREEDADRLAARYGPFGGRYVPETVIAALDELEAAYLAHRDDVAFRAELEGLLERYVGRPTPLYRAAGLERAYGVGRLYLKREDLCHTGAHKINNALGQVLLASKMGKRRIIAETGAGQHGVATATAAALLGLDCCVYMGRVDMARQRLNVIRMRMLGAEVRPVDSGVGTLKDALNEAIRDWVTNVRNTHYVIGTAAGPAPYPEIVAELQSVIGAEAREQMLAEEGRLPEAVVACVGGGSNAIGIFRAFLDDEGVALVGVEAGGEGIETGRHGALARARAARRAARQLLLPAPDARGAGGRAPLDLGRARLPGGRAGAQLPARVGAGALRERDRRRGAGGVPGLLDARRGSSPPSRAPTRWRSSPASGADVVPDGGPLLICLSGRGDKDVDEVGAALGLDD